MLHSAGFARPLLSIRSIHFRRHKSIRAAIERGRSESDYGPRPGKSRSRYENNPNSRPEHKLGGASPYRDSRHHRDPVAPYFEESHLKNIRKFPAAGRGPPTNPSYRGNLHLEYSTAASEFLYGYTAVNAAIKANRRKLYKMYLHERAMKHAGRIALITRARAASLPVQKLDDAWLPTLDQISGGRPHNGFILEASPLPRPPITAMGSPHKEKERFEVVLDRKSQSREDLAINGKQEQYSYKSDGWKHPFILYVDGVLDEGNLGNIIRSAYFLGVNAIVVPSWNSAPMSAITIKASAGAAEALPIFTVAKPGDFLSHSAKIGWRIYASDAVPAPDEQKQWRGSSTLASATTEDASDTSNVVFSYAKGTRSLGAHSPLQQHPTILMMGGEGTGLSNHLVNHAHYKVGIQAARPVDEIGVDSLNVSVAASLLCHEFLKKPKIIKKPENLLF